MRNAVLEQKFFFRTNIFDSGKPAIQELTIKEIVSGKGDFIGIIGAVEKFIELKKENLNSEQEKTGKCPTEQIRATFDYLFRLSTGEVPTNSRILRDFVLNHPEYKNDSIANLVRKITKKKKKI